VPRDHPRLNAVTCVAQSCDRLIMQLASRRHLRCQKISDSFFDYISYVLVEQENAPPSTLEVLCHARVVRTRSSSSTEAVHSLSGGQFSCIAHKLGH
jgi:hypothetical protein